MANVNAFDDDAVRKIAAKVRQLEMRVLKAEMGNRVGSSIGKTFIFKTGDETIPAMTEADGVYTPGTGEVTLYGFDAGDLESHEQLQEVFNLTTTPIAAQTFGLCYQEHKTGKLVIPPTGGATIRCARFTSEVSDDLTYGTVEIFEFDEDATDDYPEGDFVATEETVHPVFCFLRPAGETIAEGTRCHITEAGGVTVAIVVACEPDADYVSPGA